MHAFGETMKLDVLLAGLIAAVLVIVAFVGIAGSQQVIGSIISSFVPLIFVVVILLVVYQIMFAPRVVNVSQYIEKQVREATRAGRMGVPALTTTLSLAGDGMSSGHVLGKIVGYSRQFFVGRIGGFKTAKIVDGVRTVVEVGGREALYCEHVFEVAPFSHPLWWAYGVPLIGPSTMLVCVYDHVELDAEGYPVKDESGNDAWKFSHSPLVGEVVLYGSALRKVGRYYYIDTQVSNVNVIDNLRNMEAIRTTLLLEMDNLHKIAEAGISANVQHLIAKEQQKEIPFNLPFRREGDLGT